jgi:hypothetical protein
VTYSLHSLWDRAGSESDCPRGSALRAIATGIYPDLILDVASIGKQYESLAVPILIKI